MEFKQIALVDAEIKFLDDGNAFTGYASVFGGVDSYGDTIHPGAYSKAIGDGAEVKMYFNHGWKKFELPIGKMLVKQDERGLRVERAEFTRGIRMADEVALATKHGTVNGLSIGYRINPEKAPVKAEGGRDIYEIDFLKEVSVVDWPADRAALLNAKSAIDEIESLKQAEAFIRDGCGLSWADAKALVSQVKAVALRDGVAEPQWGDVLARLRQRI